MKSRGEFDGDYVVDDDGAAVDDDDDVENRETVGLMDEQDDDYEDEVIIPGRDGAKARRGGARRTATPTKKVNAAIRRKRIADAEHDDDAHDVTNCGLVVGACIAMIAALVIFFSIGWYDGLFTKTTTTTSHSGSLPAVTCPAKDQMQLSKNFDADEGFYTDESKSKYSNLDKFLQTFHDEEYDDWGYSYNYVKSKMYDWKAKHFASLQSGDSIYESACGVGLNLYMTLEVLYESRGVTDLVVYGNEYVPESVDVANALAGQNYLPAGGQLGSICHADSTDLSHVPSNAFDLVFTGYITALYNPLGGDDTDIDRIYASMRQYCRQRKTNKQARTILAQAQERQDAWFAKWVDELVRIAKPGAAVIIEQVQVPFCQDMSDWGGVSQKTYWTPQSIAKYGWDVDPDSVETEQDQVFVRKNSGSSRYHVYMRKNG